MSSKPREFFDQLSAWRANIEVALLIARNKKPYAIGEDLFKLAAVKMAETMWCQTEEKKLNLVPLFARIVKELISVLAENGLWLGYFRRLNILLFSFIWQMFLVAIHS